MTLRTVWQNQLHPLLFFAVECFKANTFLFLSILGLTFLFDGSAVAVPMILEYTNIFDEFFETQQITAELGLVALVAIHCVATISIGALWSILRVRIETNLVLQTYRARGNQEVDPTSQEPLADPVLYSYFSRAAAGIEAFFGGYLHFFMRITFIGIFCVRYSNATQAIIFWIICLCTVGTIQHLIYITTVDHTRVRTKSQLLESVALGLLKITTLIRERRQEKIEENLLTTVLNDYVQSHISAKKRYLIEHVWYFTIFFTGLIGGWCWFRTHHIIKLSNEDLLWCVVFVWVWLDGYLKIITRTAAMFLHSLSAIKPVLAATKQVVTPSSVSMYEDRGAGRVVFEHVFYGKEGGDELKDVTLVIPKASVVGLVSTGLEVELLLQLILSRNQPSRGKISIDYGDFAKINDLRVSYLGIDPILLERSIVANLSYGLSPPPTATDLADIIQVLELSSLITRMPKGLNTILTAEILHRLSDGEKQLLAVGRALLSPAPIVILDHALDRVSFNLKLKTFEYICTRPRTCTVIIATSRLASLHHVDKVFVFHKGYLVEEAAPATLLSLGGHYHRMYFAQAKLSLIAQTKK